MIRVVRGSLVRFRGGFLRLLVRVIRVMWFRSSLVGGGRSSPVKVETIVAEVSLLRTELLRGIPHRLRVSRFRRLVLVRGLLVLRRRCRFGHRRRLLQWRRAL